jgi:Ca-activated chloride channel homolog
LAEATGGRAYAAQNPQDIRTVFLDALSQRVCRPGC